MANYNIDLIILGFGKIGQALTKQISTKNPANRFRIVGLADSQAFVSCENGFSPDQIEAAIENKCQGRSLLDWDKNAKYLDMIASPLAPNAILVDTSASPNTLPLLIEGMQAGAGIVLANKHPLCRPWSEVRDLFSYPLLRYEATVGAGLPIISTLKYLLDTGDKIQSIIGCLSGTLGFLCSQLEAGVPYSQAIHEAHSLGYTEPDPRQDLGGLDVARKAIILARTAGIPAELADLDVQPLYSPNFDGLSVEDFLLSTVKDNDRYAKLVRDALSNQKSPRYSARIEPDGIQIGLSFVEQASSLGALQGTENYIALHTSRYSPSPLVISGPGAGIEVTAAGVYGDIIRLSEDLIGGQNA